ncbi:MAG: TonB-dependent receptor [Bryobacterales bacterium]|nr:TonB-dependent receptor [Bryobacterales bacterium]
MPLLRLSIALVFFAAAFAQEFRATLQGTVIDPSKATIPSAEVVLRNVDTGIERRTKTDEAGYYLFSFVPPGNYSLTVSAAGFRTRIQEQISLSLNQNARQDVELALGAAAETISVVADVSIVQPESSSLGSVVNQQIVDNLPFKGHASMTMYNLTTGVVANRYAEDTRPNDLFTNVLFAANGAPDASSDVSVDGVPNTIDLNRSANVSWWVPAMESVAEFKLQMGTLPAEYGRSAGSIMNVVIKSGTNTLHGAAYDYFRNAALDANLFFSRGQNQKLASFGVNTFGGSLGGPIYLPKIYDGRSRSFFYVNFEGSREGNAINYTYSVPTAKMRKGDFSEVSNPIYDPFSVHTVGSAPIRDPYPGNIIPVSAQDPVAQKIMTYYPEVNRPSSNPATPWVQNSGFSGKWPRNYNMLVVKLDHQLTPRHQTFMRMNYGTARLVYPYYWEGIATAGRDINTRPHFGVALNETFSISSRTTWDMRLGYTRGTEQFRPWSDGFDLGLLGFPSSYQSLVQYASFPAISVSGFQSLAGSRWYEQPGDTWSIQSSVSMQRGRHLFKTGGDGRLVRGNWFTATNTSGTFSFAQAQTGGPRADTPLTSSGFSMASLMAGYGSGSITYNSGVSVRDLFYALYFQDDYRVTPKLTLNLGVRWEYPAPRTERYDRTVRGFDRGATNPLQAPGMNLRGGVLYAGVNGQPRGLYDPDRNNIAPRLGFAYSLSSKTVLRGGYSLSYIPVLGAIQPLGYSVTTPVVSSTDGITPKDLLRNPFPSGLLPLTGNSLGLLTMVGQNVTFVEPGDRTPTFHNWQFNIQRALPSQTLFEAAYVGSRAIRIFGGLDAATGFSEQLNQFDPQYLSMGTALLQTVPNPLYGVITTGSLSGRTVAQSQLLRPYPQFAAVTRREPALGNSVYHSMQLRVEKRMVHGVTALVSYTLAKNIGDTTTAQNAYDRTKERAVTSFDVPQRLTVSATWELPFGQRRRFLSNAGAFANHVIGGWRLSTWNTFQSGFAMGFGLSKATAGAGGSRPNAAGDPTEGISGSISSRLNRYFNTAAFSQPADFTFGNLSPRLSSVRNPGMNNTNLTLSKTFQIREALKLDFRASSFNLLNHPVFSGPNTTFGDASFGRIFSQANQSRQTEFVLKLVF